jgi:type I restriction enzyme S subunit
MAKVNSKDTLSAHPPSVVGPSSNELRPLPEGWVWTTLQEVAKINGRDPEIRDLPDDLSVSFVPMAAVDATSGTIAYPKVRPLKEVRKGFTPFSDGDVIIAKITPCMENGKAAIARNLVNGRGFGSTEFHVFRPKEGLLPEFLFHFIRQESFRKDAKAHFAGTAGQLRVPASFLYDYPIPLPPLPEQERIVARLEELLSDLEAGAAALERARAGVKRYKASVLKAACEGKLFGGRGIENGELPEGWRWVKMDEIADTIGGVTKGRNLTGKTTVALPYLRVANVQRGRLDLDVMKEIEILASEVEKYRLQDGDVVLTEGGDWDKLGRSAIWRNQIPDCIHQNHIFRARVKSSDVSSEWLMFYTNSEQGQNYFKEAAKQTTNLASINLTQLRACPIPLPSLEEQRRIVAEMERRLESARAVEASVEAGLKRAGRLRQAVLRSAFEGRQVSYVIPCKTTT